MPKGIYKRSREQIENFLSHRNSFKKGNSLRLGVNMTDEQRKNISDGHKGLIKSKETREKIRDKQIGIKRPQTVGIKNANWRGGTSKQSELVRASKQYDRWRRDIFIRDEFTCTECGVKNVYLEVHHIKSFADYPDLRFDKNNGKTVCVDFHCKIDKHRKQFSRIKHGTE